ncbi:MAG TPA: hypothetical protein H9829_12150 [Candidatus Tetragenococcus pullicola]|nr:hypothetical protein [Candidatus Tetragenococcus pullicola]
MSESKDKLSKLAEERKKKDPFEKIDELEKEQKLDESPEAKDTLVDPEDVGKEEAEDDTALKAAALNQEKLNDQF